jgi:hypothetical protein
MFSSKDIFFTPPSGGYRIEKSLRFRSSASAYLNRTFGTPTNNKIFTWSAWLKIGTIPAAREGIFIATNGAGTTYYGLEFNASAGLTLYDSNATSAIAFVTTQVFRDPSSWYHVVLATDTTQATAAANRNKLYINGVQVTVFSTSNYSPLNSSPYMNSAVAHSIGSWQPGAALYFDGYLAEVNFIDGQALTPSSFGESNATTGVWQPKAYTGTYGANGVYLKFTDVGATSSSNTGYGKDFAGTNYWTTNNFGTTSTATTYDSMWDTPTPYNDGGNGVGNYCVLNPISTLTTATLAAANLQYTSATVGHNAIGSIGVSTGKWYWEAETSAGTTQARATVYSTSAAAYYSFAANATVYGFRFDADAGTFEQTADGTNWTSIATGLTSGPYFPYFNNNGTTSKTIAVNFGQRPFAYTPPSGFKALNTQNLPTPTIAAGDDYFNVILYTGTGASNARTGVGFQPDLVWIKERNAAADHGLYDAVRGVQKQLESNTTTDETTETTGLTAFDADGFTVGALAQLNTLNDTYVAWNWKESAAAGFDIVTYTGNGTARTISHNLNATPNMIIVKARTTASTDQGWPVYHSANTAAPATDYLMLNTTAATADLDTVWNDTSPTDAVFSVGTNALVNANNDTYVAYLWSAVAGYSAFGSYTGNGSADGSFVFTGFRPRWILTKETSAAGNFWVIHDTARDTYNAATLRLYPNASDAEATLTDYDILSNGFKLRTTSTPNISGSTYIYAAFAENPFKYALAR